MNLHFLDENQQSQRAVLLLHGLGAHGASWQLQTPALSQAGYRVIIPDAPGFGRSPRLTGQTSIASLSAAIAALLLQLAPGPAAVVGISLGGTLALQLALDFPTRVERLVLVNTFARLDLANPQLWPYFLLRFVLVQTLGLPYQARAVARRVFPRPEQEILRQELMAQVKQADPRGYRATMRALARFNVVSRLGEIHCPTLVITGAQDTTVPPSNQAVLLARIPSARQVILPEAGHAASIEQPDTFNRILLEFLQP